MAFVEQKWPWIAQALDGRQLVISLGVADWLNPKHPVDLEMKLRKLREALLKAEERKHIKKLDLIDEKLARGEELTPKDLELIKEAESKLKELAGKKQDAPASKPRRPAKKSLTVHRLLRQTKLSQIRILKFKIDLKKSSKILLRNPIPLSSHRKSNWLTLEKISKKYPLMKTPIPPDRDILRSNCFLPKSLKTEILNWIFFTPLAAAKKAC